MGVGWGGGGHPFNVTFGGVPWTSEILFPSKWSDENSGLSQVPSCRARGSLKKRKMIGVNVR